MPAIKCISLEEELKKNPELKTSDIQILKEWCKKLPHLPKIRDVEFAIFLHSNYYHIEPTKNTIEKYYTYKTHMSEIFSNRDVHKMQQLRNTFEVVGMLHLEGKTKEGYSIIATRLIDTDPSHIYFNEMLTGILMIYDEFLWTRGSTPGYIIVSDAIGVSIGHIGCINLISLKKFLSYVQNAMPVRLKEIHIINTSPIIETIWNIVKPFIGAELINLIQFHSTVQNVSEYIPIEELPNELGGKAGAIQELMEVQLKKLENFREWFLEDEKNSRVNESLRINKSNTLIDLYSIEGSFKKLEID